MNLTVMSQNAQVGAVQDGRWEGLVSIVHDVSPDLLLLQEVDWLALPSAADAARAALGMDLFMAPSRMFNTAIAWRPQTLELQDTDTRYSTTDLHHGYALGLFRPLGVTAEWPAPLTAISTHLTPFSVEAAGQEAQILVNRAWRYGGIAVSGVPAGSFEAVLAA
ncbi:hypothetical protein AB0L75_27840 [Streptomyces sp. NPDC052101]|uniref:hypothetical protein n=1 Tax=Streptomyces sp. NPDC052101 TaxID=3155763 RepID=UPI00341D454D